MERRSKLNKIMALTSQDMDMDTHSIVDRLSHLPEKIMYHIFSFLGPNDTVRLCKVSKRFKQICKNCPFLDFCADFGSDRLRYNQFCSYVDKLMKLREKEGIGLERFVIHWRCNVPMFNVGSSAVKLWTGVAIKCNVQELDMLHKVEGWYALPESVYECQSLRVLRLNLQMGKFLLEPGYSDSIEDLTLDSVTLVCPYHGYSSWKVISFGWFWTSLRRLTLEKVQFENDIKITCPTLEELKICKSEVNSLLVWKLSVSSSSLKVLTISRCLFKGECHIDLFCQSLAIVRLFCSNFHKLSNFKMLCTSTKILEVCGCDFYDVCCFNIQCDYVEHIKIRYCEFIGSCLLDTTCSSLECLTISESKVITSKTVPFGRSITSHNIHHSGSKILFKAERLTKLSISTSDIYSYEFPLKITAPSLLGIRWTGNPIDFHFLKPFLTLNDAIIDIKPHCRHKNKEVSQRCKLSKSLIYCSANLLESLSNAKDSLQINLYPIEIFFMQNQEPVVFGDLEHLLLIVDDSLGYQVPIIASFLKGLPNLKSLTIKCHHKYQKSGPVLSDPNLVSLLGLTWKSFDLSVNQNSTEVKIANTEPISFPGQLYLCY